MPVAQLEQTKMSADGVEGFVWFNDKRRPISGSASWNGFSHRADLEIGAPSPGGTSPGLAQPLKCVSWLTASVVLASSRLQTFRHPTKPGRPKIRGA